MAGWLAAGESGNPHFRLDADLARRAVERLGFPGGAEDAADGILRIVNMNMVAAVRLVSTARGIDPSGFVLVAYGGGGPLHGALIAEEVGIRSVLIPWSPGLTSGFGLLVSDAAADAAFTRLHDLDDCTLGAAALAELSGRCEALREEHGLGTVEASVGLDLRYQGQGFELTAWFPLRVQGGDAIAATFHADHERRYGYRREGRPIEVVTYRLRIVEPLAAPPRPQAGGSGPPPPARRRDVRIAGRAHASPVHRREDLPSGFRLSGPAVVEEASSTTIVPPGWDASVLPAGDLLLTRA